MKKNSFTLLMGGLLLMLLSFAPPPPTNYYSISDGDFTTNGNWSGTGHSDASCGCNPGCAVGNNENVYIEHAMTSSCDPLDVSGTGTLTVRNGGSLVISGDGGLTGNGTFVIETGSSVTVNGDLDISGNGTLTVDGTITVNGDINMSGSAEVCGTGTVSVTGTITGSGPCPTVTVLPVELLYFDAAASGNKVILTWATASELHNDYFTIERSANGLTFESIAEIPGAGTSNQTIEYRHEDMQPLLGTTYYRLKQTDFNGAYEYFNIVAVNISLSAKEDCILKVYPNPCVGNCMVTLSKCSQSYNAQILVELVDASGAIVYSKIPNRNFDGSFDFYVDKSNNLKPGIYFVRATSNDEAYSDKVIVK